MAAAEETSTTLADYETDGEVLGEGTYAIVYKAFRKSDNEPVALKRLEIAELEEEERAEVEQEVKFLKSLKHAHIVRYYDSFLHNGALFIVMESAVGDLNGLVEKAIKRGTRLKERTIWNLFYQISSALSHMHENRIMHRDLKPANVFVFKDRAVKLGDLGMGRGFSPDSCSTRSFLGSPYYMSPERLMSERYDYSADVWSLGCVLYELAQLHSPYFDESLETVPQLVEAMMERSPPPLPSEYSEDLVVLVDSMLDKDPTARPTAAAVCDTAREQVQRYMSRGRSPAPAAVTR